MELFHHISYIQFFFSNWYLNCASLLCPFLCCQNIASPSESAFNYLWISFSHPLPGGSVAFCAVRCCGHVFAHNNSSCIFTIYIHTLIALHSPCFFVHLSIVSRSAPREFRKRWMLVLARAHGAENIVFECALFFVLPFVRPDEKVVSAAATHRRDEARSKGPKIHFLWSHTGCENLGKPDQLALKVLENSDSGNSCMGNQRKNQK